MTQFPHYKSQRKAPPQYLDVREMNNAEKALEEQHQAAHNASPLLLAPSLDVLAFVCLPSPPLLLSLDVLKIPGSVAL